MAVKRANSVAGVLDEVAKVLRSHYEDFESGIAEGLYDDKEGFERLKLTLARFEAMKPILVKLHVSGEEMIDAYGGDVPDWLREEAGALEDAVVDLKAAAKTTVEPTEPEPAASPTP